MENEIETIGSESDCEMHNREYVAKKVEDEEKLELEVDNQHSNSVIIIAENLSNSCPAIQDVEMDEADDENIEQNQSSQSVLKHMVRFNIVYPEIKCINLRRLYSEYLEENDLIDSSSKPMDIDQEQIAQNPLEAVENTSIDHEFIPDLQLPTRKVNGMAETIKRLISRIEIEGHLASSSDFARSEKTRTNLEKDKEDLYDLDDEFIDDGATLCLPTDSVSKLWSEFSDPSYLSSIPSEFSFVLPGDLPKVETPAQSPPSDPEITEKLSKLLSCPASLPSLMSEIARKLTISKSPSDEKWKRAKNSIAHQLRVIFGAEDEERVWAYIDLYRESINMKEKLFNSFETIKKSVKAKCQELQKAGKMPSEIAVTKGLFGIEEKITEIGLFSKEYFKCLKKIKDFKWTGEQVEDNWELRDLYDKKVNDLDAKMVKSLWKRIEEIAKNFERGTPIFHMCTDVPQGVEWLMNEYHVQEYFEKPMGILLYSRDNGGKEYTGGKKSKNKLVDPKHQSQI